MPRAPSSATCAAFAIAAVAAAGCASVAWPTPGWPRSTASTVVALIAGAVTVDAWLAVADLASNVGPRSRLAAWTERQLRLAVLSVEPVSCSASRGMAPTSPGRA